jgi:hypothetical protein
MTHAMTGPEPGASTVQHYSACLSETEATRRREIVGLQRVLATATLEDKASLNDWIADQLDGFLTHVMAADAQEALADYGPARKLNTRALDATAAWLQQWASSASIASRLAAVLVYESLSTEQLPPPGAPAVASASRAGPEIRTTPGAIWIS